MSLQNWADNGWLTRQPANAGEIRALLSIVKRDLVTSLHPDLGPDWQLNIAYNAALQAATAALRASGFRIAKGAGAHHYRTLQSLL